jgi:hypothetical protein
MNPQEIHTRLMMMNAAWKENAEEKETDAIALRGDSRLWALGRAATLLNCASEVKELAVKIYEDETQPKKEHRE